MIFLFRFIFKDALFVIRLFLNETLVLKNFQKTDLEQPSVFYQKIKYIFLIINKNMRQLHEKITVEITKATPNSINIKRYTHSYVLI